MKYRDLIQFEAVTEVIQLVSANEKSTAEQLVDTYVISDRMADVILHRILPALKLGKSGNDRGLLIVGNYGTGKSHLMSVLTSVAEYADLISHLKHASVKAEMSEIAGKFKVSRQETTALEVPLRDIVFAQLEADLKKMGVGYRFPGNKEPVTNKQALIDMMIEFTKVYPDHGLLVALDELLDFLRAKNDKEMIMDLNFLREVGEACEILPLRFMAGIQEALFDNPRFQFVADSIQRVKSRFDQASIVREDIAYVVSHRLLGKTQEQKKTIRKHLEKFTPLYSEMAERLDDFEELFPVHPAYLEVFEQVTIGERRELLKSISHEMQKLLDKDLPSDQPGLITFDSYWRMICEDNAFRAIPDVRNVLDKSEVLAEKIRRAPETKDFIEPALRIIDGLALHRLTVTDIYAPIGITPAELRDRLCLYLPLPEKDADFLLATIETILKAISTAVNGQFISHNKDNDQYYLDLKKDIDYEALIQQKADALDPTTIDRYYFEILVGAMEIREATYVPGFRIYPSEIKWAGHGITRQGYIFFGGSTERSTAHPERDYYIHFLGIYGNGHDIVTPREDEVYFKVPQEEKDLLSALRQFAGASEMSAISSGSNKDQYDGKVRQLKIKIIQWLRDNFVRCFSIRHLDEYSNIPETIAKFRLNMRDLPFRDQVYHLSGTILEDVFAQKFPGYPRFLGLEITSTTIWEAAEAALKALSGGPNTKVAQVVLEGLELGILENGRMNWTIEKSPYTAYYQDLISSLEPGKVINRSDLVAGEPGAERDTKFNLEPEFFLVVLAALVRQGALSISVHGLQITEVETSKVSFEQMLRFTSISKPKPLPEQAVKELFIQYNLDPAIVGDPRSLAIGVTQLQLNVQNELDDVVRAIDSLRDGPKYWREMILSKEEQNKAMQGLEELRKFLSTLQSITSVARLSNLTFGVGEIRAALRSRHVMAEIKQIQNCLRDLDPVTDYLSAAQTLLPANDPWQEDLKKSVQNVISTLASPEKRKAESVSGPLKASLENVQSAYINRYTALHNEFRLDRDQDQLKSRLTSDPRWARMRSLSKISLLPSRQLQALQDSLGSIETCPNLQPYELKSHTHCPHCGFNPIAVSAVGEKASARLERVRDDFESLCTNWVDVLLINLQTESAVHSLDLIDPGEREAVKEFLRTRKLPEPLTERFIVGVENTLQGLEVISVVGADYLLALTVPGMPCTPDELEKRIRTFIQKHLEGKDRSKIRIQINW